MNLKTTYKEFWQKYGPRGVENSGGNVHTRGRMSGRELEVESANGNAFNPELGGWSRIKSTDSFALFRSVRTTAEAAFIRIGKRSRLTNLVGALFYRSINTGLDLGLARKNGTDQVVIQNGNGATAFGANIALENDSMVDIYINDGTTGQANINFKN